MPDSHYDYDDVTPRESWDFTVKDSEGNVMWDMKITAPADEVSAIMISERICKLYLQSQILNSEATLEEFKNFVIQRGGEID